MKHILLSFSLLTIGAASYAQNAMVKDISVGQDGSFPTRLTSFGKQLVFFANDQGSTAFGNELYAMDSAGAITMAFNINPGTASSANIVNYLDMAVAGGKVYFPANDGTHGVELFSWDGVHQPTMVKDLYVGASSSNVSAVTAYQNKVYFNAATAATGNEVWVYDPGKNTMELLADIVTGVGSSSPQNFAIYNNKLYFSAIEASTGRELYVYDAKADNVKMVADINTGAGFSDPQSLVVANSRLYFSATDPAYGRELYCIFDTTLTRLTDVFAGANNSVTTAAVGQNRIGILNGAVYFCANDGTTGNELYMYDHKTDKTSFVYKINPLSGGAPSSFTRFSNKLYFTANDGVHGNELWSYDGKGMPVMVVDIDTAAGMSSNPMNFVIHGDGMYFSAGEGEYGTELYVYRDPAVGIQKVSFDAEVKVYPNPTSSVANIELKLNKNESLGFRVMDMTGKKVYDAGIQLYSAGNNTIAVPMQSLTAGVYFYTITNANGNMLVKGKIIKQ